jgi:hypothetical protein
MANRFDLQNPAQKIAKSAAKGQTYGKATEQMASQSAVPMGASPSDVSASRAAKQSAKLTSIGAPTQRPDEPITAGANFGAGPNMYQAGIPMTTQTNMALEELRAIAMAFPNDDLDDLLSRYGIG